MRYSLIFGAVHGHWVAFQQVSDSAHVIAMEMGNEKGYGLQILRLYGVNNRNGIASRIAARITTADRAAKRPRPDRAKKGGCLIHKAIYAVLGTETAHVHAGTGIRCRSVSQSKLGKTHRTGKSFRSHACVTLDATISTCL